MCQHPPDGPISPGPARSVPAVGGTQAGQSPGETAADLTLRATRYLHTRFRERVIVRDLSAHLAYSPPRFTRAFTPAVGTSLMGYLAAWRLREARHLLTTHRLGMVKVCREADYTSMSTFNCRFLHNVGAPPGSPCGIADRVAERTQPAVNLLVPVVGRICTRLDIPEGMRRTLGPALYQWVGTFPRPVLSRLLTSGSLRRHIDGMEPPMISGSSWILAAIFPDGADVHEQLAPINPLVMHLRVPEEPVPAPVTSPVCATFP